MARDAWSESEVREIVTDYLAMLREEVAGRAYSKADHRRALSSRLPGRSQGSIEFKHANISAVLNEVGLPYIFGYKPRANYQHALVEEIKRQLANTWPGNVVLPS